MKKSELKELYQMMFPDYPDIVTVKQLREMLGFSRALAYKLISDGEIQAVKIGTSLKIPSEIFGEKSKNILYISYYRKLHHVSLSKLFILFRTSCVPKFTIFIAAMLVL